MKPHELSSEITPEKLYFSRRKFIALVGSVGLSAALAACGISSTQTPESTSTQIPGTPSTPSASGDELTPFNSVTHYNNFYEFSYSKEDVASAAANFKTSPWTLEISGLVKNPMKISVSDLIKKFAPEERIYRFRCVEGWSMVIPWNGFSLSKLLSEVEVAPEAAYVNFSTPYNTAVFPNQIDGSFSWPYTEGLRLDEANNDLTILAVGLYGKDLLPQDGAPIRLVVPWKYGFKSIKSVQKIELVQDQPATFWNSIAPDEYGFYANVNPNVPHPRWSQSTERRIGEVNRRPTLLFNGYADQVASLYQGMDLQVNY